MGYDFDLDVGDDLTDLPPQGGTELNIGDTDMGGMGTELPLPMPSSVAGDDVPALTREDSPLS